MNVTSSAMNDDDAARWAVRLGEGALTSTEEQALDDWLHADERRQGALLRAEAALAYLDRGRAMADTFVEAPKDDDSPVWTRRRFLIGGSTLAGLTAASVTGFILTRPAPIEIRTALGEIRRVPLPDGSVASVNTASDVAVVMVDKRRDVRLNDGEAWFQVAHDKNRPFVVEAGTVRVKAVGTAFSVRRRDDGADVLVTEGLVEVWVEGHENQRTQIAAGSKSFVAADAKPIEVASAGNMIDRALSWRTGELALNGESLDYAVAELNRYNARKIVIDTPALGRESLVGYFRVDQPEGFGQAIEATMAAKMSIQDNIIHLSR
ncbi:MULTISPECIES: FecR family protein [Sphingomonadaceae]|nr:FecR domain-containing protein [Sphingobium yanoikuyae]MDH2149019.1 FecR domain-containing protein [Sphingobium yanoikuyae]